MRHYRGHYRGRRYHGHGRRIHRVFASRGGFRL